MLGEESKVRYTIFINLKHKQFILFVFLDTCLKLKQSYTKVDWVRIHTSFTRVIEGWGKEEGDNASVLSVTFCFLRVILKQKWQNLNGYLIWVAYSWVFVIVLSTLLCVLNTGVLKLSGGGGKVGWRQIKGALGVRVRRWALFFRQRRTTEGSWVGVLWPEPSLRMTDLVYLMALKRELLDSVVIHIH